MNVVFSYLVLQRLILVVRVPLSATNLQLFGLCRFDIFMTMLVTILLTMITEINFFDNDDIENTFNDDDRNK